MLNSANCWLGVSLDYLGAAILFLVITTNIVAALAGYIAPADVGKLCEFAVFVNSVIKIKELISGKVYPNLIKMNIPIKAFAQTTFCQCPNKLLV